MRFSAFATSSQFVATLAVCVIAAMAPSHVALENYALPPLRGKVAAGRKGGMTPLLRRRPARRGHRHSDRRLEMRPAVRGNDGVAFHGLAAFGAVQRPSDVV